MSKGNICTPARHFFYPPSLWRTGGPAHQVVKNEEWATPLFFKATSARALFYKQTLELPLFSR
jgi:hypothetical protein